MPAHKTVSDTVTVTADGRTIVDITKLLAKKHIQEMIREMRGKTKRVSPRRQSKEGIQGRTATD